MAVAAAICSSQAFRSQSSIQNGKALPTVFDKCDKQNMDKQLNNDIWHLHKLVFHNDIVRLATAVKHASARQPELLDVRDGYGHTALHLAVMLGHHDCAKLLASYGAQVRLKTSQGWNALFEAVSYGDRTCIHFLLKQMHRQNRDIIEQNRTTLVSTLQGMRDFVMTFKWDFYSWGKLFLFLVVAILFLLIFLVPFLSKLLPSDVCRISKKGARIRLDTTLLDFKDMHWERGDVTFLFDGTRSPKKGLFVLDNKARQYHRCRYEESEKDLADEVDALMSSDMILMRLNTDRVRFEPTKSGWIFKTNKQARVGRWRADFYNVEDLVLEYKKRCIFVFSAIALILRNTLVKICKIIHECFISDESI